MAGAAIKAAEQEKTPERLLVEAANRIKKLETKVADQQGTIRGLRSQIRQDENLVEQISEMKLEISDLKGEIRELTRANHEFVARYEAIRGEASKSKVDSRGAATSASGIKVSARSAPQAVAA
jgi:predicted  nucleic acid-binding Zn-ribbon protein